ncbi:MAG: tetratricopeptide repeat protein [Bacteroidota bacterium]
MSDRPILDVCIILCFVCFTTPVYAQFDQQAKDVDFTNAKHAFELGFFEESVRLFERFLNGYPEHRLAPDAGYHLARARSAGDSTHIEFYYRDFIQRYPESDYAKTLLKDLGHRFTNNGEYAQAIAYYEESMTQWMDQTTAAETKYWIAEAAAQNTDYQASRLYFLELADEYPESEWAPRALYARGRLYLTEGQYEESTQAFELLRERYPNDPVTRRVGTALGESYYQQARYPEAIEALRKAMLYLDDESKIKALFLQAESYNYLGNYNEASKAYLQYINLTKGTLRERPARYGLGWLYHRQQIYHWAADEFSRASEGDDIMARKALYYKAVNEKLSSNYERSMETFRRFGERYKTGQWVEIAYYEWAIAAFENANYDEAIEVLVDLVRNEKDLNDPGKIYTFLGEVFYANAEYTSATQAFEQAEKVASIDPELRRQARFQKAWIQFRNQAYEQAQPLFESVYAEDATSDLGAEALFWSADSYYKLNRFSEAAQRFNLFAERYPENELIGAARYSLGWSYFKTGNFEAAVGPLEAFLEEYNPPPIALFPYDTDTQLRIGDAYYAMGDYRKSIQFYTKAIGAEPGGDYAMFQVANSYYRANRTFEAVTNFRKLLRIYPFSRLREQAQYNIAYIYLNTANYTQAIEEFQTVINKYPGTSWAARAQYNIGDAFYNAGEYERAIDSYKKVLATYPRSSYVIEAVNGIQYAQLSAGRADSSSYVLEEFLSDNPQSRTADRLRFRQAENILQSGDYEGAVKEFRQYLRITNSDNLVPDAYTNLGDAYRELGQMDNAISAFQTIVDEFPEDDRTPSALESLGRLSFQKGEFEASHRYYQQLSERAARYKQGAFIGMGNASLAQDKLDEAKTEYNSALGLNPNNDAAKVGISKIQIRQQEYEAARLQLAPIADRNTTEIGAEAQFLLGRIEQNQQRFEEAVTAYAKVKILFEAFDDWVSNALFQTAECQIRLGQRGDALATLRSIVESYPGTESAERAQQLIEQTSDS